MKEIIKTNDSNFPQTEGKFVEIKFDDKKNEAAKKMLQDFGRLLALGQKFKNAIDQNGEYILKIPKDIQEGIDKGIYWLNEKSDGSGILPDVMGLSEEGRTQIKKRLTVEKKFDCEQFSNGLQNYAMQQQMAQMSEDIKEIYEEVKKIEKIQKITIFSKVEATYDLLKMANVYTDENDKKQLILNSLVLVSESSRAIKGILEEELNNFSKIPQSKLGIYIKMIFEPKTYMDKKNEQADEIMRLFDYYEKSVGLMALANIMVNQREAMELVLSNFEKDVKSLETSKIKTIQYLHPTLDLTDKWFWDKDVYTFENKNRLVSFVNGEYDYIELKVDGKTLMEVI